MLLWLILIVLGLVSLGVAGALQHREREQRELERMARRPNYSEIQRLERDLFGDVFTRNPKHPSKNATGEVEVLGGPGKVIYYEGRPPVHVGESVLIEKDWDREARERLERRR